ncbi:MAG TPA: hypothetical protein VM432_07135 [Bdellovibrionales bacterium]|nr:hypothetical protein [Bdellovibrionales bacterium]
MKYISLIIVLVLMVWTWNMTTAERAFSLEQHRAVETGVEADVRALIQSKYPTTTEIFCQQLYTEVVKVNEELMAHFRCRALGTVGDKEKVEQTFEGHVLLKSEDGFKSWQATAGNISASQMQFLNGVHVSAKDADSGAEPEKAPSKGEAEEHK